MEEKSWFYKKIWAKRLPFKIYFCLWRIWKNKIPIDEVVARCGIVIASRYGCCTHPQEKTVEYLFLKRDFAKKIWERYSAASGIQGPFVQIKQTVVKWWKFECNSKLKTLVKVVPALILWQIWRWRNTILYGGNMSIQRVYYEIDPNLHILANLKYPKLDIPNYWPNIVQLLEKQTSHSQCTLISWRTSPAGNFKCNTYGSSKGNPET